MVEVYDRWTPFVGDPNLLDTSDPNFIIDEIYIPDRVKPLFLVPIGEDDYIRIEFVPDTSIYFEAFGSWLMDDRLFDMNNDGIVNLQDWTGAQ